MKWSCVGPEQLTRWRPGTRTLATHTLSALPDPMRAELPADYQDMLDDLAAQRLPQVEEYRLNLLRLA